MNATTPNRASGGTKLRRCYVMSPPPQCFLAIYEALRKKVELLGELHEIKFKFHILKIEFLREKIIFFGLDFFPGKVWLCSVQK